jgi:putative transposase
MAPAADAQKVIDDLHCKIGQLQIERDFLALPMPGRRAMIAPEAELSVSRQFALLGLRAAAFVTALGRNVRRNERLDRIFTNHPVYGSRRLQVTLLREGISIGRRRVRRLMRKLGLWAVRPKRNTSKPHPEHTIYPYLLRGQDDRPAEPGVGT